ncbi:SLBB domain-containing protein [candidate division KSB1 bacterium]|nr:SLBB domain-containing protein [candidate division KSB1 bacterium]
MTNRKFQPRSLIFRFLVFSLCIHGVSSFRLNAQTQSSSLRHAQVQQAQVKQAEGNKSGESVFDWNTLSRIGMGAFTARDMESYLPGAVPVNEDYQLGPGDRIGIYLLGKTQREYDITINAENKAYLPAIGVFDFGNHSLLTAKEELKKLFDRYFSEKNFELLLIQPKMVMVSVVGEVNKPGRYTLSGLQTVFDAVFNAGGLTPNGSLRNIQLLRTNDQVVRVDLYELLVKGWGQGGPPLQPGDVIQVPPLKSSIRIAGEIYRSGIYELDPTTPESLQDMFTLADDLRPLAYLERVEISRRLANGEREVWYVDVRDTNIISSTILQDDDHIRIYSLMEQNHRKTVEILGEVRRPGVFTLEQNLTLRDLILKAGGPTRTAHLLEAQLDQIEPKKAVKRIKFPLETILKGMGNGANLKLDEYDRVIIRRIPEWLVGPSVEVKGEAMFPGIYTITKDSTFLSEILKLAGGLTKDAFLQEAKLFRPTTPAQRDREYERLKAMRRDEMTDLEYEYLVMKESQDVGEVVVNFNSLWNDGDRSQDIILKNKDVIYIPRAPQVVEVTGRVAKPGGVLFKSGANLNYYIEQVGGVTWDARPGRTKVIKSTGEIMDDEDVKELLAGDIIWVPRKPDRDYWKIFRDTMLVMGQLATVYLVVQNSTK